MVEEVCSIAGLSMELHYFRKIQGDRQELGFQRGGGRVWSGFIKKLLEEVGTISSLELVFM